MKISSSYFIYSLVFYLYTTAIILPSVPFNDLIFQIPAWVSFPSNLSTFKAVSSGEVTLPAPPPAAHSPAARAPIFLGERVGKVLDSLWFVCFDLSLAPSLALGFLGTQECKQFEGRACFPLTWLSLGF